MRYVSPKCAKIELSIEEYEILDNAYRLLKDMRQKLSDEDGSNIEDFVVYDERTDIDSTEVTVSDLAQALDFLYNII